jgi:ATP-dependent helicase/nuclease subunit A
MNEPVPTDPDWLQQQASDPTQSVWVNASAGSGKTKVLTQRVVRLLLDGVPPHKILCLTFTRAAAAEMSNRIATQLSHWATCSDNDLSKAIVDIQGSVPQDGQLDKARRLFAATLSCPGGMRIRTIHAFCQEILRRFPIEAGLPPHFNLIEGGDADALRDTVMRQLLREMATQPDTAHAQALKLVIAQLGDSKFTQEMSALLRHRDRIKRALDMYGGLESLRAQLFYELGLKPADTRDGIIRAAVTSIPEEDIRAIATILVQKGTKTFRSWGQEVLAWLGHSFDNRVNHFDDYIRFYLTKDNEIRKKFVNKEIIKSHPDIERIIEVEAVRVLAAAEQINAHDIAALSLAISTVTDELIRRVDARKTAQAALDYDDLIARTKALLLRPDIAPWVLYKLDGGIDHILVDEAQDTSRAQWDIVSVLADEFFAGRSARDGVNRTLFVVGDEKQSIFSFQNADPEAFAEQRQIFSRRIRDAGKVLDEVPLNISFRSAPAILRAVDTVFAEPRASAGVIRNPTQHEAFHQNKIGHVEVWPRMESADKEKVVTEPWTLPVGYEEENNPQAELAAQIGDVIAGWLVEQKTLLGTDVPLSAGDIMILLRRRGDFADFMVRALKARHVPVTGIDRMKLVEQIAVMDILALMQFTLLPDDDLNLATVLRGPLLDFSEDDLMRVAVERPSSLWQSLKSHADVKTKRAVEYLTICLNRADRMTPYAMLAHILSEPCPGSDVSGRHALWTRLGHDALDPIEELLNIAQSFSHRHSPSLQSFVHWLSLSKDDIKREMDRGSGEVRIMTVHAAKGLEAPIVFLPDAASGPRSQDMPKLQWINDDLPLYVQRQPLAPAARRVWDEARAKQLAEYRRLLYVALTRAANQLYIAGWKGKKDNDYTNSWYDLAATALKKRHDPSVVVTHNVKPDIVFGDPVLQTSRDRMQSLGGTVVPALPAWARRAATFEHIQSDSIAPSHVADSTQAVTATASPNDGFARGIIIHRLLQSLPDIPDTVRDMATARFLANPQHGLSLAQQKEIGAEVLQLLRRPDYAPIFSPLSRAEVPVAGYINGQRLSGQIDRLCVTDDAVWIVDYKTNRPPPINTTDVSEAYIAQLQSYQNLMKAVYPNKPVRCFLLWTYAPLLMEIPITRMAS